MSASMFFRNLCLIALVSLSLYASITFFGTGTIGAVDSLDHVEAERVKAAIERANAALARAYHTGDVQRLEDAFVDHPDYLSELQPEKVAELGAFIARVLGAEASQNFGYLTAMQNKINFRLQGEAFVQVAIAQVAAEGREFTSADLQVLSVENPDKYIVWPQAQTDLVESDPVELQYKSIEINGDKARAVYDDGVRDKTAILVRIDGQWFVAGIF
jgi:hypothetical protein